MKHILTTIQLGFTIIFIHILLICGSNDWYYTDPSGNKQGPFSDAQMRHWSNAGYFSPDTLVQHGEAGFFQPISQSPLSIWPDPEAGIEVQKEHKAVLKHHEEERYSTNQAYFRGMHGEEATRPLPPAEAFDTEDEGYYNEGLQYQYDHYAEGRAVPPVYDHQEMENQRYQQSEREAVPYQPPAPSKTAKAKKVVKKMLKTWLEKKATTSSAKQSAQNPGEASEGTSWQHKYQDEYRQQDFPPYYGNEADDTDYEVSDEGYDVYSDAPYSYEETTNNYPNEQSSMYGTDGGAGYQQEPFEQGQPSYPQESSEMAFTNLDTLKEFARDWYRPEDLPYNNDYGQDQWGQESEFVEEDLPPYVGHEEEGPRGDFWDPTSSGEFQSVDHTGSLDPQAASPSMRQDNMAQFDQGQPGWGDGFGFDHGNVMDREVLDRGIHRAKERYQLEEEQRRLEEEARLQEEQEAQEYEDYLQQDFYAQQGNDTGSSQFWTPEESGYPQHNGQQLKRHYDEQSYYPDDKGYERHYDQGPRPDIFEDEFGNTYTDGQGGMEWMEEDHAQGRAFEDSDDEEGPAYQVKRFLKGLAEAPAALLSRDDNEDLISSRKGHMGLEDDSEPKLQPGLVAIQSLGQMIQMHPLHSLIMVVFDIVRCVAPVIMAIVLKGLLEQMITVTQAAEIGTSTLQLLVRAGVRTILVQEALLMVSILAAHTSLKTYIHPYLEKTTSTTARLRLIRLALSDNAGPRQIWRQDLRATARAPFQQARALATIVGISCMMLLCAFFTAQVSRFATLVAIGTCLVSLIIESVIAGLKETPNRTKESALESTLLDSSQEAGSQSSVSDLVPIIFHNLASISNQIDAQDSHKLEALRKLVSTIVMGCTFVFALIHISRTATGSEVGSSFLHLALFHFGTILIMNKLPSLFEKSVLAKPSLEAVGGPLPSPNVAYPKGCEHSDGPDVEVGLEAKSIWYSHPTSGPAQYALQAVTVTAYPGQMVAVVGPDGSGKSTLSKILQGRVCPDKGEVSYQGRPLEHWASKEIRRRSVEVDQMGPTRILSLSIKEVVGLPCLEKQDLEDANTWASACAVTGAYSVVQSLPQGLETPVGEAGLSAGQWQRFLLTRPFLKPGAELIVLDDPAHGLPEAEAVRILAQLRRNLLSHQVLIVFSHKVCIGRLADNIIYLENGKVMEEGHHTDLMALSGRYAREMQTQCSLYSSFH